MFRHITSEMYILCLFYVYFIYHKKKLYPKYIYETYLVIFDKFSFIKGNEVKVKGDEWCSLILLKEFTMRLIQPNTQTQRVESCRCECHSTCVN